MKCKHCGFEVITVCCNSGMAYTKPYEDWDWWTYCTNKTCQHHEGEGQFQDQPDWVE